MFFLPNSKQIQLMRLLCRISQCAKQNRECHRIQWILNIAQHLNLCTGIFSWGASKPATIAAAKTTHCWMPLNCLPIEAITSALIGRSVSPRAPRALPPQDMPLGEQIVIDGSPTALPSGSAPERAQATLRHSCRFQLEDQRMAKPMPLSPMQSLAQQGATKKRRALYAHQPNHFRPP